MGDPEPPMSVVVAGCVCFFLHYLFGWQTALALGTLVAYLSFDYSSFAPVHTMLAIIVTTSLICYDIARSRKRSSDVARTPLYFERQRLMHCAIHALNNLFQKPWMDKRTLDALSDMTAEEEKEQEIGMTFDFFESLSYFTRFRMPVFGNYGWQVIEQALKLQSCEIQGSTPLNLCAVRTGDSTLAPDDLDELLSTPGVRGLILAVSPSEPSKLPFLGGKHWLAVVSKSELADLGELDWGALLLDSKQDAPVPIRGGVVPDEGSVVGGLKTDCSIVGGVSATCGVGQAIIDCLTTHGYGGIDAGISVLVVKRVESVHAQQASASSSQQAADPHGQSVNQSEELTNEHVSQLAQSCTWVPSPERGINSALDTPQTVYNRDVNRDVLSSSACSMQIGDLVTSSADRRQDLHKTAPGDPKDWAASSIGSSQRWLGSGLGSSAASSQRRAPAFFASSQGEQLRQSRQQTVSQLKTPSQMAGHKIHNQDVQRAVAKADAAMAAEEEAAARAAAKAAEDAAAAAEPARERRYPLLCNTPNTPDIKKESKGRHPQLGTSHPLRQLATPERERHESLSASSRRN